MPHVARKKPEGTVLQESHLPTTPGHQWAPTSS